MENFTSKRNGALDKECENAESLTMLSRELVLKEAMRLELEREAVEAERKRAKQSIFGPDHGKISSQREERDLRNRNKLMAFNLDNFDPVYTTKENWQNYETIPEMNTGMEELLTELNSVNDPHQNFSCG